MEVIAYDDDSISICVDTDEASAILDSMLLLSGGFKLGTVGFDLVRKLEKALKRSAKVLRQEETP